MYSTTIKPKVDEMFNDLQKKINEVLAESISINEAVNKIAELVGSETASRSKTILSDMLFDLNDSLLKTSFFAETSRQNRFAEVNLRQEILSKYQFTANATLDFSEAMRIVQALKVAGSAAVIIGAGEIGIVLIQGLTLSTLVTPLPIATLVIAALGAAIADYLVLGPNRSKKKLKEAVNQYLIEAQQQFLNWFDEIECYFNRRVDELKRTM